ncbi:hypothetical protein CLAFUW4_04120 [Fulvia fulva]|uniref:Uncharacterized protein n=1 Tax=Passalora fulva TaxID=5499 RepID=A0A9Q8LIA8_PASFU|nr:uncharacterized protein CLAFUR5_04082 [Fulvia fulva]KAK4626115.1 hypothetical protein CLAFUR4_04106 [Fulvia fulva]KAK4628042.1 hypothetical protein CLAFUR0_04107 [Fulvia fulva]UJO17123.1 hypothetical protein CLAFUR5_04082 [Fulvia fulva]WPV13406.1 hypothetical protein CLAFUW4_04120 [Fulvia fulva]WPV28574.1 hypothetical protein CLAFUW7_04109 [Fulvia fulva]
MANFNDLPADIQGAIYYHALKAIYLPQYCPAVLPKYTDKCQRLVAIRNLFKAHPNTGKRFCSKARALVLRD